MCRTLGQPQDQACSVDSPAGDSTQSSFQVGCVGSFLLALQHPWVYGVLLASGSHPQPGCATREVGTGVIPTCYDQLGVEEPGILLQLVIVNVTSLGVDLGEEEEGSATSLGEDQLQCCPAGGGAGSLVPVLLTLRGTNTYNCILYLVGHGLEEERGGRDLLLVRHEPMGEVAPIRQVQSHDPAVRLHQGRVHSKVCR